MQLERQGGRGESEEPDTAPTEPLVSVVTPVFNTEKYLAQCIESVLSQTYRNFEYVIVDNQSTDRSLEIAQWYAVRDSRVRVHRNEAFLAQMPNWNHALRLISDVSAYCKVVHADDWIFPDCIEEMVGCATRNPSVGLVGAYRLDENRVNLDGLSYPSHCTSGREIARMHLLGKVFVFGAPTSLLIRSDIVRARDAFYEENNPHADIDACLETLRVSDFGFVHKVLTFTRRHNESATSTARRFATTRVARLKTLEKYGPFFLEPDELEWRSRDAYADYYGFLARQLLEQQPRAFWRYHRNELAKIGRPLDNVKIGAALATQLLDTRRSARHVVAGFRRRAAGGGPSSE